MADLRIVDAPVLLQESITDDVKMPTGGLGNYAIRLGDLVWYVVTKEQLASKSYVDTSSQNVQNSLDAHISDKANPHQVTKEQVGLGNVDNTADIDKPVSNAVSSAIVTATTDMATKAYVNQKDNLKADKATTLSGYGITDAYTKTQVDSNIGDLTTLKTIDKTTLVKAINELHSNTEGVVALYDKNIEAGAGANGWTDLLISLPNGRNQRDKNLEIISVKDYGASPSKTAAENDIAFAKAFADLNAKYNDTDGLLKVPPAKGCLIIPADGIYQVSQSFNLTGNYSFLMFGNVHYVGADNTTVFKIGHVADNDNISDLNYVFNLYTTVANVKAYELKNFCNCHIQTLKIKGFVEALHCVARGGSGFFGNTFRLGTFDSNIIDINLRSETNGWANANRFYDGFFYKQGNYTGGEQNCVKFSSDGTYTAQDSNIFDGCHFEEGKANATGAVDCIPINLEVGIDNTFINIRTEQSSNTALARVKNYNNKIHVTSSYNTSLDIISDNLQHTYVKSQHEMFQVYNSGDLSKLTSAIYSGVMFADNISFADRNAVTERTAISKQGIFSKTEIGIKLLNSSAMLSFKVLTNNDYKYLLKFNTDKALNIAIVCYDANGNILIDNESLISDKKWGVTSRIKTQQNGAMIYSSTFPFSSSNSYVTQAPTKDNKFFELHPSVHSFEVFLCWAFVENESDNQAIVSSVKLLSEFGRAVYIDNVAFRNQYKPMGRHIEQISYISTAVSTQTIAANSSVTLTQTTNITPSDYIDVTYNAFLNGLQLTARVSDANTIEFKISNSTNEPINLASGNINCKITHVIY